MSRPLSRSLNSSLRSSSSYFRPQTAFFLLRPCQTGQVTYTSRPFHSSVPTHSAVSRFARWAWYKKDGTPRSKLRGLLISTGILVNVLLLSTAVSWLSDVEDVVLDLAAFIQIQQVDSSSYSPPDSDSEIKQRNWDDWTESILYFQSICKPVLAIYTWGDPDVVDQFFRELGDIVKELEFSDNPSGSGETESLKAKIHNIMNTTSHAVHLALKTQLGNPDVFLADQQNSSRLPFTDIAAMELTIERALEVVQLVRKAIGAILRALQERKESQSSGEIDKDLTNWFKVKGDESGSGRSGKGKGYDIIG
ncbi:hypothetical protein GYMLUDRAFT_237684 [Collybiopsis luxurians FD-317 M1]|nr:hypothetical protein GYMLUDRAFT_237684 [Collybiopsis luxurians FD-317 M1]